MYEMLQMLKMDKIHIALAEALEELKQERKAKEKPTLQELIKELKAMYPQFKY